MIIKSNSHLLQLWMSISGRGTLCLTLTKILQPRWKRSQSTAGKCRSLAGESAWSGHVIWFHDELRTDFYKCEPIKQGLKYPTTMTGVGAGRELSELKTDVASLSSFSARCVWHAWAVVIIWKSLLKFTCQIHSHQNEKDPNTLKMMLNTNNKENSNVGYYIPFI